MMKKVFLLSLVAMLFPLLVFASGTAWQLVPEQSTLTFTAIQNDAPVTGEFKKFTADINFDPTQLSAAHVKIIIDVTSITDSYHQLADTLTGVDWFNAKVYPQAIFLADHFVKIDNKNYQANGTLTLRDKTLPVTISFSQEEFTAKKAVMKGSTTIKRTAFGIGQGEWSDTKTVKDDVQISFTVTAIKK